MGKGMDRKSGVDRVGTRIREERKKREMDWSGIRWEWEGKMEWGERGGGLG